MSTRTHSSRRPSHAANAGVSVAPVAFVRAALASAIMRAAFPSAGLVLVAGCSGPGAGTPPPEPPVTDAPVLTRTTFLGSLANPWDIAFSADGAMFFTQKCSGLSVRAST